jgi:hypothetical protein
VNLLNVELLDTQAHAFVIHPLKSCAYGIMDWDRLRQGNEMPDQTKGIDGGGGAARSRPRLLEQVHDAIHRRYFSLHMKDGYAHWIKRFIYFSDKRQPI